MTLDELRKSIDLLDAAILEQLNRRCAIGRAIGEIKREQGLPVRDPQREASLLAALAERNPGPISDAALKNIYRAIIQATIEQE